MARNARPVDALPLLLLASVVSLLAASRGKALADLLRSTGLLVTALAVVAVLGVAALLVAALAAALLRRRLLPIALCHVALASTFLLEIFVLHQGAADTQEATDRISMHVVATRLWALAQHGGLPEDPRLLEQVLAGIPPQSRDAGRWRFRMATCSSSSDAGHLDEGLVVFCVLPDRSKGWLVWSRPSAEESGKGRSYDPGRLERVRGPSLALPAHGL